MTTKRRKLIEWFLILTGTIALPIMVVKGYEVFVIEAKANQSTMEADQIEADIKTIAGQVIRLHLKNGKPFDTLNLKSLQDAGFITEYEVSIFNKKGYSLTGKGKEFRIFVNQTQSDLACKLVATKFGLYAARTPRCDNRVVMIPFEV